MSSFDEIRSGLLKKYNVSAAGTSGSTSQSSSASSNYTSGQPNSTDFYTIRRTLLDKYSDENTEQRRSAVANWADRYSQVMQGVSAYDTKRNGGYTQDASGGFRDEIDSLIDDFDGIKEYADRSGLPNAQRLLKQLQDLRSSVDSINESMLQFEDEDSYNRYMEYWKDQEEKKNLDLYSYSREIAALEQQLEDYDPQIDWTDTNQRKQYDAGLKELEDEINRRKQYLAQAQRLQKKDEFSAVANPESEK